MPPLSVVAFLGMCLHLVFHTVETLRFQRYGHRRAHSARTIVNASMSRSQRELSQDLSVSHSSMRFNGNEHKFLGDSAYTSFFQAVKKQLVLYKLRAERGQETFQWKMRAVAEHAFGRQLCEGCAINEFGEVKFECCPPLLQQLHRLSEPDDEDDRNSSQLSFGEYMFLAGDYFSGTPYEETRLQIHPESAWRQIKEEKTRLQSLIDYVRDMSGQEEAYGGENEILKLIKLACYREADRWCAEILSSGKSKFAELAENNINHFSDVAEREYKQVHEYALRVATSEKSKEGPLGYLSAALQIEGTALHFFTDRFSAGHVRVPRLLLHRKCPQNTGIATHGVATPLSGWITKMMHEEDGALGLWVKAKGDKAGVPDVWRAFGDGNFFTVENRHNVARAQKAVQASIWDVLDSFLHAHVSNYNPQSLGLDGKVESKQDLLELLPEQTGELLPHVHGNHPPLVVQGEGGTLRGRTSPALAHFMDPVYVNIDDDCNSDVDKGCMTCHDFSLEATEMARIAKVNTPIGKSDKL